MPQGTGEWHIDVELLIEFYTCLSNVCTSQSIFRCRKMIGQRYHYEPTILSQKTDNPNQRSAYATPMLCLRYVYAPPKLLLSSS